MRNVKTKEITFIGVLSSIILVLGLVPNIGYVPLTPLVGFTIIHIPLFIGAYFGSRKAGGILGLVFGLTSLFAAFTRPALPLDPVFTNPMVSVLPRFLVGFFAYDVLQFFKARVKTKYVSDALFFGSMTLIHSVLVITLLYIAGINFWYFDIYGIAEALTRELTLGTIDWVAVQFVDGFTFFGFLLSIVLWNSLLETVIAIVVGVPVVDRLKVLFEKE